jgi:hypothetical protein
LAHPGPIATGLVVVAVVVLERSVGAVLSGLGGALAGGWLALNVMQLGLLAGAAAGRARVHRVTVGVGGPVWRRGSFTLRRVPVLLSVGIGPGRARPRPSMVWAGVLGAVAGLALVAVLYGVAGRPWAAAAHPGAGGAFWRGATLGALAWLGQALAPRSTVVTSSTGWLLWSLPRLPAGRLTELAAEPMVDAVIDAIAAGDLPAAETALGRLREAHPALRATVLAQVSLLEAHGRYAEAMSALMPALSSSPVDRAAASGAAPMVAGQTPREVATGMMMMASLAAAGAEAGQLPVAVAVPVATNAVQGAGALGLPAYRTAGVRAVLALLEGRHAEAVTLATVSAKAAPHPLEQADDLATLARALMAGGDNRAARQALERAERLAAWWPRVAATRSRLEVGR